VPTGEHLGEMAPGWREAFTAATASLRATGVEIVEVDIAPLLDAARMLYGGAFVAERYAAVGAHIESHRDRIGSDLDPVVAAIILAGAVPSAAQWASDTATLARLGAAGRALLAGCDALPRSLGGACVKMDRVMDPSRKRAIRLTVALTAAGVVATADRTAPGRFADLRLERVHGLAARPLSLADG